MNPASLETRLSRSSIARISPLFFPAAAGVVFLAVRILFLYFLHPFHLFIFPEEELYRGALAKEIIQGLAMPYYDYRPDDYAGGSLVAGFVISVFFRIFGMTAFALKLEPLLFSAAGLFFWLLLLSRHTSKSAARIFAFLFIFSPPAFTRYSLVALGDHPESLFFTSAAAYFLFEILSGRKRGRNYALLGFFLGSGIWYAYITILSLITAALFSAWNGNPFSGKKNFTLFSIFFMLGFAPWILANQSNGLAGLEIAGTPLWRYFHVQNILKRIWHFRHFVPYQIATSFDFQSLHPSTRPLYVVLFYNALFFIPAGLKIFEYFSEQGRSLKEKITALGRPRVLNFSLLYILVFAVLTSLSDFHALRYYMPLQPFLFCAIAHAVDRCKWMKGNFSKIFIFFLAAGGIFFHARLCSARDAGYAFRVKGYDYQWLISSPVCRDPERCVSVMKKFEPKLRDENLRKIYDHLADQILEGLPIGTSLDGFRKLERQSSPRLRKFLYPALGLEYVSFYGFKLERALEALEFLKPSPELYRRAVSGAVSGAFLNVKEEIPVKRMKESALPIPESLRPQFWRDRGAQGLRREYESRRVLQGIRGRLGAALGQLAPGEKEFFLQGLGIYLHEVWNYDPPAAPFSFHDFDAYPEPARTEIFRGVGFGSANYDSYDQDFRFELLKRKLDGVQGAEEAFLDGRKTAFEERAALGF